MQIKNVANQKHQMSKVKMMAKHTVERENVANEIANYHQIQQENVMDN